MRLTIRCLVVVVLLAAVGGPALADPPDRKTQRFQDVIRNLNAKQMTVLLEAARTSRDRDVKELAKEILKAGVIKVTGEHVGGFGGGSRGADPEAHCTVRAGTDRKFANYHVYLKEKDGRLSIIKITK